MVQWMLLLVQGEGRGWLTAQKGGRAAATSPTEARVTMTAVMVAVNFILKVFWVVLICK